MDTVRLHFPEARGRWTGHKSCQPACMVASPSHARPCMLRHLFFFHLGARRTCSPPFGWTPKFAPLNVKSPWSGALLFVPEAQLGGAGAGETSIIWRCLLSVLLLVLRQSARISEKRPLPIPRANRLACTISLQLSPGEDLEHPLHGPWFQRTVSADKDAKYRYGS
jgi:hypothetical protein